MYLALPEKEVFHFLLKDYVIYLRAFVYGHDLQYR